MKHSLQVGTARVEITPAHPIALAGFAFRSGAFERVHSPVFLRALLFAKDGPCPPGTQVLLISADLFCWGADLAAAICDTLSRRLRIASDAVILHGTHNHSGPQTSRLFPASLGAADDRYLQFLHDAVLQAAECARTNLEPVTVERGSGKCDFAVNRRKIVGGVVRMAPNPDGPLDPEVTVARFRTSAGCDKALLVHYTCHPTTSGTNQVCAEYPGLAMADLEQDTRLVAAFLQGCCGDVRPALVRDGEFYRGDGSDAARLAAELAGEIRRVLAGGMQPCTPGVLELHSERSYLPLDNPPTIEQLRGFEKRPDIRGEWSRFLLANAARLAWAPELASTRLDLAADLGLLTFNAEMMVPYGLHVKTASQGKLLPIAFTNGMLGYVPTRSQIEEGGYEPAEAFRYYGKPAAFTPGVETAVSEHIRRCLGVLIRPGKYQPE